VKQFKKKELLKDGKSPSKKVLDTIFKTMPESKRIFAPKGEKRL